MWRFTIPGHLMGLNEYTTLNRSKRGHVLASKAKREQEARVSEAIDATGARSFDGPIELIVSWYDGTRRDPDNVEFAVKFILDAMVSAGVIPDDSRKYVKAIRHQLFDLNKRKDVPERVEVYVFNAREALLR